jgi:hypothetical protein
MSQVNAIQQALDRDDFRSVQSQFTDAKNCGRLTAGMWLSWWRRCNLHDSRKIARLEGRKTEYRLLVIDDEPHIQTPLGCYSVEELAGKPLPSLAEIASRSAEVRRGWCSEEMRTRLIGDYRTFLEG